MPSRFLLQDSNGRVILVQNAVRIGRADDCELVVRDARASRHHATAWVQQNSLYLRDEGSANGTYVNGTLVRGPHRLNHGDRISIGNNQLTVLLEANSVVEKQISTQPPDTFSAHPSHTRKRRPASWLLIAALVGLMGIIGIAALIGGYFIFLRPNSTGSNQAITAISDPDKVDPNASVIALALRLDLHTGALNGYIGPADPDPEQGFWLPAGTYYIEALLGNEYYGLGLVPVVARQDGGDWVDIAGLAAASQPDVPDQRARLLTLVDFLVSLDLNRLRHYEVVSGGFRLPLYGEGVNAGGDTLLPFYAGLSDLARRDVFVTNAIDSLAKDALSAQATSHWYSRSFVSYHRQDDELRDEIFNFFQQSRDSHQVAINLIANAATQMTAQQKAEAFDQIGEADKGSAQNFDDMLSKLQSGELPYKGWLVHGQLYLYSDEYRVLVDQKLAEENNNVTVNRAQLFLAQEEGGKMLQAGAELNVKIIKTILSAGLPGIEQGFEYADKVNDWSEYIRDIYQDPIKTLSGTALDQVKGDVQEHIKNSLLELDQDMDEAEAEAISGQISDHISQQLQQLVNQAAQSGEGEEPDAGQESSTGGSGLGGDGDTSWIDAYIEDLIAQMVQEGVESLDGINSSQTVDFANDLEACLRDAMAEGFTREEAEGLCLEMVTDLYTEEKQPVSFDGNWYGPRCENDTDFEYKWGVGLIQDESGAVRGTVRLHFCPGGGSAIYQVTGTPEPGATSILLAGTLIDSYGEQGKTASANKAFTFSPGTTPQLSY